MLDSSAATSKSPRGDMAGRLVFVAVFFIPIAAIWVLLFAWKTQHSMAAIGLSAEARYLLSNPSFLASFCWSSTSPVGVLTDIAMWGMMSIVMMLPTAAPFASTYFSLIAGQPFRTTASNIGGLLGGYIAGWLIFSIGAGLLQWELARLGLLSAHGTSISAPLSTSLLFVAGLYQFSTLKAACLSRCRSPLAFFMSEWRDGPDGAFRMGLRHGRDCLGCCWVLMLIAFVGGTMNLLWMAIATALMTLEKLPLVGRLLTKPVGAFLIGCAAYLAWLDFTTA